MGVLFTLLKGVWINPWSVGVFDIGLLTILIAYLFLSFGGTQALAFALGQGFLIDIFSGGLHGLFTALYLCVFGGIFLGSRFFNLQTPKGQIVIVSLAIFLKNSMLIVILALFSHSIVLSMLFLRASAVSIIATGLIAPILFSLFNRLRDATGEEATPSPEEIQE